MTIIDQFQNDYRRISAPRRKQQDRVLRELADHAGKDLLECTAADIRAYLSKLLDDDLHANTVRKALNMIRPFYKWAWSCELIEADRYMRIQDIPAPNGSSGRSLPRPYSRKELRRFWEEFDRKLPTVKETLWERYWKGTTRFKRVESHCMRIQVQAIVTLALHCGLRPVEVYSVEIDDVHYDNEYIVVRQRGASAADNGKDKYREVPHTKESRRAIYEWIELRTKLNPGHDFLWLSLSSHQRAGGELAPMHRTTFQHLLVNRIGAWELHRFRHTAGTNWLRATKRIEIVQRLLGHSTIEQTLAYAKVIRDDLHDAVHKAEEEFMEAVA